jgi:hypothetical protein
VKKQEYGAQSNTSDSPIHKFSCIAMPIAND